MMARRLVYIAVAVAIVFCGVFFLTKPSDFVLASFSFKNSHDVVVYDSSETVGDGNDRLVTKLSQSGQSIKLNKYHEYFATYQGDDGYTSGNLYFTVTKDGQVIKIEPYYSQKRLKSMSEGVLASVNQAYQNKYGDITAYSLRPGKLYHYGDWYGATLIYKGDDTFNDDTLRIVFHKDKSDWTVATIPPNITLSKFIYPNIPVDVLRDVNNSL